MDSVRFHAEIVALFKAAIAAWDWNKNPLEWEYLPNDAEALFVALLRDALKADDYGGPIRVGRDYRMDADGEAEVVAQLHAFEGADDYAEYREKLSDALIRDCETADDDGSMLALHICAIRKSLEEAERKASERGWGLTIDA